MDGNPPQEKKNLKNLPFWEIGLVEFGFVAVVLILLFGILNYFNILSISDAFPQQFSWLPRQVSKAPLSAPNSSLKPTPSVAGFNYDTVKAKQTLSQYIKVSLKPNLVPPSPAIEQNDSMFTSRYTIQGIYFSTYLKYQTNTQNTDYMRIFVNLSNIKESTLTADLTNSLVSTYFVVPFSLATTCKTEASQSYCESFNQDDAGKRGFGVVFGSNPDGSYKSVFTCFVPRESENFEKQTSCILF